MSKSIVGPTIDQKAKRQGIAVESLVTAACVLGSKGELNAATSLVDDDGVDLVLFRMAGGATLSLQVKATFTTAKSVKDGNVKIVVKKPGVKNTFHARVNFFLLFLVVDATNVSITRAWLVPSTAFSENLKDNTALHFFTSLDGSENRWAKYKILPEKLAAEVLSRLCELEPSEGIPPEDS